MDRAEQLRILAEAGDDPAELTLAVVDLAFAAESPAVRADLRRALEVAAVPHWVTPPLLAHLLETPEETAAFLLSRLRRLTLLEAFPSRGEAACNVHEQSRLAIRRKLALEGRLAAPSIRAAEAVRGAASQERIEALFHRAVFEPLQTAEAIEALGREWRRGGRIEEAWALAVACDELHHLPGLDEYVRAAAIECWALVVDDHVASAELERVARELIEIHSRRGDARRLASGRAILGVALSHRGDERGAREAHLESLTLRRSIAPTLGAVTRATDELVREVYMSLWLLIDLDVDQRRFAEAEERVGEALELTRTMAATFPHDVEWQRDAAIVLWWRGRLAQEQGHSKDAHAAFSDYLAAVRELFRREPNNPRFQDDLCVALEMVGQLDAERGANDAARRNYLEAIEIRRRLRARDPVNTDWARGLSLTLSYLADLDVSVGRVEDARRSFEEVLDIDRQRVAVDPARTLWQRDLALTLTRLAQLRLGEGRLDDARSGLEEALAVERKLSSLDPANKTWRRDVELTQNKLGRIALGQNRIDDATRAFEEAIQIAQDLLAADPTDTTSIHDFYFSHCQMAQVAEKIGDRGAALDWLARGRPLLDQLLQANPDGWRDDVRWLESETARLSQ